MMWKWWWWSIHHVLNIIYIYVDGEGGKLLAQRNVFVEKSVQIFEVSSFSQRHSLFVTVHTLLFTYINLIEERLIFYFSIHTCSRWFFHLLRFCQCVFDYDNWVLQMNFIQIWFLNISFGCASSKRCVHVLVLLLPYTEVFDLAKILSILLRWRW